MARPPHKIMLVVGTRPNFMKMAPIVRELHRRGRLFAQTLVHTGQHYDAAMWRIFVDELELPDPDHYLGVGVGSHGEQIARTIERLEPVIHEEEPDLVLVPGDVNSTLGAALAARTRHVPVGHVEAGLRNFDPTMPEELNRRLVDQLSRFLFIHSPEAYDNLVREGCDPASIHDVGNTMIDTLVAMQPTIEALDSPSRHDVVPGEYVLVTLHRPALVDTPLLGEALRELDELAERLTVLFPVHPRTRLTLDALQLAPTNPRVRLLSPLGYLEFLGLLSGAAGVVTDSGGIQEEATFLGIPCFTLRETTERPVTVELGTNLLLGLDPTRIAEVPDLIADARGRPARVPKLWDGQASVRIVDVLAEELGATARPLSAPRRAARVTPIVSSPSGDQGSS